MTARKDLRAEARGGAVLSVWLTLGIVLLAVVLVTVATVDADAAAIAPSALWLVFALISTMAFGRGFRDEHAHGAWQAVLAAPAPASAVFLGKVGANLVLTLIAELAVIIAYSLVVEWPASTAVLAAAVLLGTIGISVVGTFVAAFTSERDSGDLLLPLMTLPVLVPLVALAAQLTRQGLGDGVEGGWWVLVILLAGYDLIVLATATLAFGFASAKV